MFLVNYRKYNFKILFQTLHTNGEMSQLGKHYCKGEEDDQTMQSQESTQLSMIAIYL